MLTKPLCDLKEVYLVGLKDHNFINCNNCNAVSGGCQKCKGYGRVKPDPIVDNKWAILARISISEYTNISNNKLTFHGFGSYELNSSDLFENKELAQNTCIERNNAN